MHYPSDSSAWEDVWRTPVPHAVWRKESGLSKWESISLRVRREESTRDPVTDCARLTGDPAEIARYLRVFGADGRADAAVTV